MVSLLMFVQTYLSENLTRKSTKKADDKIMSAKFRKTCNRNCLDYRVNTIDQDEMAHYEPSHLDLQCLQIQIFVFGA